MDVLTLSASPTPRTLQMSLSGVRDTSTIRSPLPMRPPIVSNVQEFDEGLIKDAIEREVAHDRQCYCVVPHISQLEEAGAMLARLFPGLRIEQAHRRMPRVVAEENIASFADSNYDVNLATTVIKNGMDIPGFNTIIMSSSRTRRRLACPPSTSSGGAWDVPNSRR